MPLRGAWAPADSLQLAAGWEWLTDLHPDGQRVTGPGDLELATLVRVPWVGGSAFGQRRRAGLALGWSVKLPNAANEGELGSDETDCSLLLLAGMDLGPLRGTLGGGLVILGNPLLMAAQDDVPYLQGSLSWDGAAALGHAWLPALRLGSGLAFKTPWNPARSELDLELAWGRTWRLGLAGGLGLTAAAPQGWVGLTLGVRALHGL